MADVRGVLTVKAGGEEYRLFTGMSVLADLQAKHGRDVLERLEPPADASPNWMPELAILTDLILGSLQRFHADQADRWLADDILASNGDILGELMGAAFPEASAGNAKGPKKAAA